MVSPRGKCEKFRQFVKTDAQPFPIIFSHISFSMIKEGGEENANTAEDGRYYPDGRKIAPDENGDR